MSKVSDETSTIIKMEKIKPITLEIEKKVWEEFKSRIPRNITLNEKVVELIKNFLTIK